MLLTSGQLHKMLKLPLGERAKPALSGMTINTFHCQTDEKDKDQTAASFSIVIGIQRLFQIK